MKKIDRLVKYVDKLKDRLQAGVPKKQLSRVEQYKQFLTREIESTTKTIEALKLEGTK